MAPRRLWNLPTPQRDATLGRSRPRTGRGFLRAFFGASLALSIALGFLPARSAEVNAQSVAYDLSEGSKLLQQKKPDIAIQKYFDPVIDYYQEHYSNSGVTVYSAVTRGEAFTYSRGWVSKKPAGKAVVLDGTWVTALIFKGIALTELGQTNAAVTVLKRATELAPGNPAAWYQLGYIEQSRKNWPAALYAYKEAAIGCGWAGLSPTQPLSQRILHGEAYVLMKLGDLAIAENFYKQYLMLNSQDDRARKELAYIEQIKDRPAPITSADASHNAWIVVAGQPGTVFDNPALAPENLTHDQPAESGLRDGTGAAARFKNPGDIALDAAGNLFVLDQNDTVVRKITPAGNVTTLARLPKPKPNAFYDGHDRIAIAHDGGIFVSLVNEDIILSISTNGREAVYAGQPDVAGNRDGPRDRALFSAPQGLAFDQAGNLYVADSANNAIREIRSTGLVTTLTGGPPGLRDGPLAFARFEAPSSLAIDKSGNIYVAEYVSVEDEGQGNTACAVREIGVDGTVVTLGEDAYAHDRGNRVAPTHELGDWLMMDSEFDAAIAVDSHEFLYFFTGLDGMGRVALSQPYSEGTDELLRVDRGPKLPMPVSIVGIAVDKRGTVFVSDGGLSTIFKASPPWGSRGASPPPF